MVLSRFVAEHLTGLFRFLIFIVPCWMEAPWFHTVLTMLEYALWQYSMAKDVNRDVLVDQVLIGLPSLHCTVWLLKNVCCADKGSLPQSVRKWWGDLRMYNKGLLEMLETVGKVVC